MYQVRMYRAAAAWAWAIVAWAWACEQNEQNEQNDTGRRTDIHFSERDDFVM